MRRVLAVAALVAFMPTANAQDKAKADFSHNGELRLRYWLSQNPGAQEDTQSTDSDVHSRFKLGTTFKASEKVSAHLGVLHNATFGEDTNTDQVSSTGDNGAENILTVNEAYGNWMFSDDMSFRVGRQNYQIADGTLIGYNDWEANPGAFEGLLGNWEAGFGKFQLFMFKYRDLTATGTHPTNGSSASADPEHNAYGINFDMKTTPEWFKALNVHVVKDNADAIAATTAGTPSVQDTSGMDLLRYGVMAGFNFAMVDLKAWYEMQGGSYSQISNTGAKTEVDAKGSMMQAEVGFNMENFMGSRFHFRYHQDSGNDGTSTGEVGKYDPYFTEAHNGAGMMDLFGWGNLTYMQLGWAGKMNDKTSFGAAYSMFSRTEKGTGTDAVVEGSMGSPLPAGDIAKDDIGSELDLWAEHMYDGGLSTLLQVGYFMPGDYYDNPTTDAGDKVIQVLVQGKMSF